MEKGSGADLGLFPGRFRGHGDRPGERRQHEKPGAEVFGNHSGFRTRKSCRKVKDQINGLTQRRKDAKIKK